jgi:GNAT superfamily N-acetyltransferase
LEALELRPPQTEREFELYYDLRWRVLREPWKESRESARDEHENQAIHMMALIHGIVVGVGRLHFSAPHEGQVRYMAVEERHAGQGIGGRLLEELERHARLHNATRIVLNARENAVVFYRKHGYQLIDQSGTMFGSIAHWWMQKNL